MSDPSSGREAADAEAARADAATARLRKADVWTGLVLAAVAFAMVAEALTFPLEGTYAGVRNAWYVSPALFPLIVGGMLFILSVGLVGKALADYRRLRPDGRVFRVDLAGGAVAGRDAVLIAALIAAYVVGLVPRVDFVAATALFLFVFMAVYVVTDPAGRRLLAAILVVPAAVALLVGLAGAWPAPRTAGQFVLDGVAVAVLVLAVAAAAMFAAAAERRRLLTVALTSVAATGILAVLFRYGLLVPLPREGLGMTLIDHAVRGLGRITG